jgi:hypothetical protein
VHANKGLVAIPHSNLIVILLVGLLDVRWQSLYAIVSQAMF